MKTKEMQNKLIGILMYNNIDYKLTIYNGHTAINAIWTGENSEYMWEIQLYDNPENEDGIFYFSLFKIIENKSQCIYHLNNFNFYTLDNNGNNMFNHIIEIIKN